MSDSMLKAGFMRKSSDVPGSRAHSHAGSHRALWPQYGSPNIHDEADVEALPLIDRADFARSAVSQNDAGGHAAS